MDFARKQLEKYGWTDGKGLGKHEDGISEAIRPKLKRSVTGVGHDPAAEFNEHWWSALYDKAAKNVEVQNTKSKTKIKTNDSDNFSITNNTYLISKKSKNYHKTEQYDDYFVKKAVLSGGSRTENVKSGSESETEDVIKKDVTMTDEELFKACGGRTAHKGARHGLKATGKLARIQQQEQMLLSLPKYEGYSHAKQMKQNLENVVEESTLTSEEIPERKKKKKKKRCFSNSDVLQEYQSITVEKTMDVDGDTSEKMFDSSSNELIEIGKVKKSKKKKRKLEPEFVCEEERQEVQNIVKKKKKLKDKNME